MIDDLRASLRAGGRSLLDPAIWRDLALAPFSLPVLGRLLGWVAAVVVGGFASLVLPGAIGRTLALFVGLAIAFWLVPLAVRRASTIIVRHALGPNVATQPLLPASAYRHWWAPLIAATQLLPAALAWLGQDNGWLPLLALLAAQSLLAPGAVVRAVLAPALPATRIKSTLSARRVLWTVIAFAWLSLFGLLQALTPVLSGPGALLGGVAAWRSDSLGAFLLARIVMAIALYFAIAIFCTAALARFALGIAAPEHLGDGERDTADTRRTGREPSTGFAPWGRALVAVALVAGGVFLMRARLAYWVLGEQTRQEFVQGLDWSEPFVRQLVRTKLACVGKADKLRVLSWGGIRGDGSDEDMALACAAYHGHLAAVQVLVAAGDDIERAVPPLDSERGAAPQTPLQLAVRTPAGLPVADWLLSHHKRPQVAVAGQADLVQTAAAWNCLACIEWLHDRGFAMDAHAPATPLALWLDQRSQDDRDDIGDLARLVELGLSPSAVGEDGRSALHAAAADANGPAVDFLIAHGADPSQVDADGMTPLLYAGRQLYQTNPGESAEQTSRRARRVAVILKLIPLTPMRDSSSVEHRGQRIIVAANPYIDRPENFERVAALDPAIRAAADQAGPATHGEDADALAHLPADQATARLDTMDGRQLATVLSPSATLTTVAARAGWWPQLLRAVHGWQALPQSAGGSLPDCILLDIAMAGEHDRSRDQADSWDVVVAWLDSGRKLNDCNGPSRYLLGDLQRRSRAQQADWATRTGGAINAH